MPGRKFPLVTNEIYHVFNRGIDRRPTFVSKRECQRAIETLKFYRFTSPPLRLSKHLQLNDERQKEILKRLNDQLQRIKVIALTLMPNHFHLLLKQERENGISKFLGDFQNSYTRYFNTKNKRDGSLFLDQFKAVRIETDEQLVHVSRYIHLNPYASYVVKSLNELEAYPYSSLPDYLSGKNSWIEKGIVLGLFKNTEEYKKFVFDEANYQRRLKEIEHLLLEK